jgi:hypothetical protein
LADANDQLSGFESPIDPLEELADTGFRVASIDGFAVPFGDIAAPAVAGLLLMTDLLGLAYRQRRRA